MGDTKKQIKGVRKEREK